MTPSLMREKLMMSIRIARAEQQRRYSIQLRPGVGWEVCLEENQQVMRHAVYRDWHRVERVRAAFMRQVDALTHHGWQPLEEQ